MGRRRPTDAHGAARLLRFFAGRHSGQKRDLTFLGKNSLFATRREGGKKSAFDLLQRKRKKSKRESVHGRAVTPEAAGSSSILPRVGFAVCRRPQRSPARLGRCLRNAAGLPVIVGGGRLPVQAGGHV